MSRTKKATEDAVAERMKKILWECHTWGKLEAAAGVTDRRAFWKHHPTEESARAALRSLIEQRARAELTPPTKERP